MRVLITGASGFIGTALTSALRDRGDEVVPLGRGSSGSGPRWDITAGYIDPGALDGIDAVVHLAGASILPPWTKTKKRRILDSRVQGTDLIARAVAEAGTPTLLTASGMDYYGDRGEDLLTESEPVGTGFMAEVSAAWEAAAAPAVAAGARVCHFRTSLALDGSGGVLPLMMLPFKMFVGGPIGGGRQWWSWISIDDEVRAILHLLDENGIRGPVNLASPNPVRNKEFMAALGKAMGRPSWFPAPAFLVRAVLGKGPADSLVLESKRIVPAVLEKTGFVFSYPEIGDAMARAMESRTG
jgi:uncharacterized protein